MTSQNDETDQIVAMGGISQSYRNAGQSSKHSNSYGGKQGIPISSHDKMRNSYQSPKF